MLVVASAQKGMDSGNGTASWAQHKRTHKGAAQPSSRGTSTGPHRTLNVSPTHEKMEGVMFSSTGPNATAAMHNSPLLLALVLLALALVLLALGLTPSDGVELTAAGATPSKGVPGTVDAGTAGSCPQGAGHTPSDKTMTGQQRDLGRRASRQPIHTNHAITATAPATTTEAPAATTTAPAGKHGCRQA